MKPRGSSIACVLTFNRGMQFWKEKVVDLWGESSNASDGYGFDKIESVLANCE